MQAIVQQVVESRVNILSKYDDTYREGTAAAVPVVEKLGQLAIDIITAGVDLGKAEVDNFYNGVRAGVQSCLELYPDDWEKVFVTELFDENREIPNIYRYMNKDKTVRFYLRMANMLARLFHTNNFVKAKFAESGYIYYDHIAFDKRSSWYNDIAFAIEKPE